MSPHSETVPNLGRRSPGSGSLPEVSSKDMKNLITEYQRLMALFAPLAWPLQQGREESFESSKYTNCFSL